MRDFDATQTSVLHVTHNLASISLILLLAYAINIALPCQAPCGPASHIGDQVYMVRHR